MNTVKYPVIPETALDEIIGKHRDKIGKLLSTLEEAQERNPFRFLPPETLISIAHKLQVPYTQVYSVVTFYSFFHLQPQGKHIVTVCRGTACHTKGSKSLLTDAEHILGYSNIDQDTEKEYTTPDHEFTVRTVACFGQCAQSPVVSVDGTIYSTMNAQKLIKILAAVKGKK